MNDKQTHEHDEHELISALADGQLDGADFAAGVHVAARDEGGREAWAHYHLIGEVLRNGDPVHAVTPGPLFLARFQDRLQAELAASPAPLAATPPVAEPVAPLAPALARTPAANDGVWRWKWLAGAASVAAVAAIGWNVAGTFGTPSAQVAVQTPPQATPSGVAAGPMLRDPRLDELLAAHRQLGGASALQTPAGFLRNATFEAPAR